MDKVARINRIFMMSWLSSLVIVVAVMAFLLTSSVRAVSEQAQNNITISPSSTELTVDAGQIVTGMMKVLNEGDTGYEFTVYARPYGVANERYEPDFTTQNTNANVYKWVQFSQPTYRIEPGQSVDVSYTLRVPADAAPGGHYGVLFAESGAAEMPSTGVARKNRVGNLLYITVNGSHIKKGEFKGFVLPTWQTSAPMISSLRVHNSGNVDFRAKVTTIAKDMFGRTKYTYTGEPIVLPQTTRLAEMKWENAPNFGLFKVDQRVEFLDDTHQNSGYVLLAPRWAPIALIILVATGAAYAVLRWRKERN